MFTDFIDSIKQLISNFNYCIEYIHSKTIYKRYFYKTEREAYNKGIELLNMYWPDYKLDIKLYDEGYVENNLKYEIGDSIWTNGMSSCQIKKVDLDDIEKEILEPWCYLKKDNSDIYFKLVTGDLYNDSLELYINKYCTLSIYDEYFITSNGFNEVNYCLKNSLEGIKLNAKYNIKPINYLITYKNDQIINIEKLGSYELEPSFLVKSHR
jgi:hypothetical protein